MLRCLKLNKMFERFMFKHIYTLKKFDKKKCYE